MPNGTLHAVEQSAVVVICDFVRGILTCGMRVVCPVRISTEDDKLNDQRQRLEALKREQYTEQLKVRGIVGG